MADEPHEPSRGLSPERKAACRKDFADGFEFEGKRYRAGSIAPLARKYGIARNTLKAWVHDKTDPWTISDQGADHMVRDAGPPDPKAIGQAVNSKVVSILTGQALGTPEVQAAAAAAGAAAAANVTGQLEELLATQDVIRSSATYMKDFFKRLNDGEVKLAKKVGEESEATQAATAMRALKTFVETTRRNTGLRDGVPSVPTGEEDGAAQVVEFVIIDADKPTGTDGGTAPPPGSSST